MLHQEALRLPRCEPPAALTLTHWTEGSPGYAFNFPKDRPEARVCKDGKWFFWIPKVLFPCHVQTSEIWESFWNQHEDRKTKGRRAGPWAETGLGSAPSRGGRGPDREVRPWACQPKMQRLEGEPRNTRSRMTFLQPVQHRMWQVSTCQQRGSGKTRSPTPPLLGALRCVSPAQRPHHHLHLDGTLRRQTVKGGAWWKSSHSSKETEIIRNGAFKRRKDVSTARWHQCWKMK